MMLILSFTKSSFAISELLKMYVGFLIAPTDCEYRQAYSHMEAILRAINYAWYNSIQLSNKHSFLFYHLLTFSRY